MDKIDITNLTGKCLVAMPSAEENSFSGSVVYICSHSADGAMGFIVNKRIKEFSFSDLATQLPFESKVPFDPITLYNGGPLERAKGFIIHSDEYRLSESLSPSKGIMVSSSLEVLQDIAAGLGPKQKLIALGYAGWAPHQLETEIENNMWLVAPATPELVFGKDDDAKWFKAASSLGIAACNLAPSYGHS